jgi:hypothetical protein
MDIFHALSDTVNYGGGTYDVWVYSGDNPDSPVYPVYESITLDRFYLSHGYIAGGNAPSSVYPVGEITLSDVASFVKDNTYFWGRERFRGETETYRLGFWLNDGNVHLDVVSHFNDKDAAVEFAIRRNELAIYDLREGEDIDLSSPDFDEIREEIAAEKRLTGEG